MAMKSHPELLKRLSSGEFPSIDASIQTSSGGLCILSKDSVPHWKLNSDITEANTPRYRHRADGKVLAHTYAVDDPFRNDRGEILFGPFQDPVNDMLADKELDPILPEIEPGLGLNSYISISENGGGMTADPEGRKAYYTPLRSPKARILQDPEGDILIDLLALSTRLSERKAFLASLTYSSSGTIDTNRELYVADPFKLEARLLREGLTLACAPQIDIVEIRQENILNAALIRPSHS